MFLVCTGCGTVAEPNGAGVGRSVRELADVSGFELHAHILEVTGLCPECSQASGV